MSARARTRSPRRLRPGRCRIRHIRASALQGQQPPPVTVNGRPFYPSWSGLNGDTASGRGFSSGSFKPMPLNEPGEGTVTLPNAAGSDGRLHRDRFAILTNGRAKPLVGGGVLYTPGTYRPGDEWLEVYTEGKTDRPAFIGTPIAAVITPTSIQLQLGDGYWTLKKTREKAAGFWAHAPRDVIEHYMSNWQAPAAHGFDDVSAFNGAKDGLQKTTADGLWDYQNAGLRPADAVTGEVPGTLFVGRGLGQSGRVSPTFGLPMGTASSEPHTAHRIEVEYGELNRFTGAGDFVDLVVRNGGYNGPGNLELTVYKDGRVTAFSSAISGSVACKITPADAIINNAAKLAIEVRGRWTFFYVNGRLVITLPTPTGGNDMRPQVITVPDATGAVRAVALRSFLWRRTRPYLAGRSSARGDLNLAGAPPAGGLQAEFYNDADLMPLSQADRRARRLDPTRQPYARKLEPLASTIDTGLPPGPPNGEFWSARYMGSIYLDLANHDYTFSYNGHGRVRIYVGKTRTGEEAGRWGMVEPNLLPTPGMRAHLGTTRSGWYPILVEYLLDNTALDTGISPFRLHMGIDGGGALPLTSSAILSPIGIVRDQFTKESHFDLVERLLNDWAYQARCEPRQLEGGQFPAEMLPKVRVGRDTDRRLTESRATAIQSQISADEVADALLTDSAGLGGSDESIQLTAEVINYAEVGRHLFISDEYDQSSSIALPELALQRATSLLTLRSGPWQEVTATPDGASELADTLPLSGVLSKFAWEPGDALALDFPTVGVVDELPRVIDSTEWPFAPTGLGVPAATYRQRRRDNKALIGQEFREARNSSRYGQGQVVQVDGSIGSNVPAVAGEPLSRLFLPPDARIIKAWVGVQNKSDTSAWTLQVNGVSRFNLTAPGTYDVTAWITAAAPISTNQFAYATLAGGTGNFVLTLHALVAVDL